MTSDTVVASARLALEKGDVTTALKWVQAEDAETIRVAFAKTTAVRALSPGARDLADTWFFETLVRIHRKGEGVSYTGLKLAGEVETGIALADKALASGKTEALLASVTQEVARGVRDRFARVQEAQPRAETSVAAGREYVEAYVDFIHYVERLYESARGGGPSARGGEGSATASHGH